LRILKDPSHGTFGVLAIVLSTLLRIGTVASLDPWSAVAFLPSAHALSRGASAVLLGLVPPAAEGLGASYASATSRTAGVAAGFAALLIGAVFAGAWVVPAALAAAVGAGAVGAASVRRLGGITGDVLGAAQQVAEVAVLLFGAAAATSGGSWSVPWWR
jgi:adenosylcobinamide-GDP ribazoletransferase